FPEELGRIGRTKVSESLAGIVATQGRPLSVPDIASDPRAANRELHRKYGSVSYLGVPIIVKEKTIGVLNIYTKEPHAFSEEEIELLSTFADQAGIAIENARLYQGLKEYSLSLEEMVRERTRELEETNVKLEKASRHKSEFLANMSHEVRTPLNSIIGFSEILTDLKFGDLNERQARYVSNILISGKHLLQLINDLLDLSKVEAGRMDLQLEEFSLAKALEDSLTIIRPQADKKNLSLDLEMEGDISITADPVRFKQIMYNLLSNAVKFTPSGGSVRVTAHLVHGSQFTVDGMERFREPSTVNRERHGDFVEIAVHDTGIGIKPEDQERIFLPFQQVDGSLARRFEGTGLGLALTRQLIEMHGGSIWVQSEGEGKGSKFSFVLPLLPSLQSSVYSLQ
ncbi:MAG: GAF domain-containing protein, partial [candidate division NC10 bacterium]|nr:GAF domain-containing protein [candidate division NC10 bacterium]